MSRSIKRKPIHFFRKEAGWARKSYRHRFRKTTRRLTHAGKYDSLPRYRGTCGWDTW